MEAQDDQENNGSCEKGSNSSNLKLKIRYPKLKKEEDVSRGDEDVNNVREEKSCLLVKQKKDHICCECGKEFSSGKALGGHMSSAHVQANQRLEESWKKKNQEKSSKLMKRRFDDDDEEEEIGDGVFDEIIKCKLCKKIFPSKKSLFGHMRCHPDRDWRGMEPPSKKIAKNKGFQANFHHENVDVDVDVDEDENRFASIRDEEEEERSVHDNVVVPPLKGWGAKDRRGRSPFVKKRSFRSINSDDEKELHDGVQVLLSLGNGDYNNNNNNNSNSSEVMMCSSNSVGSAPKEEAPLSDLKDKSKRKMIVDEENREETDLDSLVHHHKKRKREKELIIKDNLVQSPVNKKSLEVKHKCNVCGKIFTSHQALGGHRSSHNKFKISIENTIDHHQDQEIKARNQEDNNQEEESSSSQIASNVLDFDLNELPDLNDDRLL